MIQSATGYITYVIALMNYPEQLREGYSNRFLEVTAEFLCQTHCVLMYVCVLLLSSYYLIGQLTVF